MTKKLLSNLKILSLAVILSLGLSYVYAWTGPTATAPGGNVAAPLNTSSAAQTKPGDLTVNSIYATQHCIGASCISAWPVGGSDNLGNHTATIDLNMSGKNITNAGLITTKNAIDVGGGPTGIERSTIVMRDDESLPAKAKYIYADSNVVGFLSGAGSWLSYWTNTGDSWQAGNANFVGRITSASTASTSAGNVVVTKDYVDAAVLAAGGGGGGGLSVYTANNVLLGRFIDLYYLNYDQSLGTIIYADSAGKISYLGGDDRGISYIPLYYVNSTCTGLDFIGDDFQSCTADGTCPPLNGYFPYRSRGNVYSIATSDRKCSDAPAGYGPLWHWNFNNSTCTKVNDNYNYCQLSVPKVMWPKKCGAGDCLIK